jgi:hypothetical protein
MPFSFTSVQVEPELDVPVLLEDVCEPVLDDELPLEDDPVLLDDELPLEDDPLTPEPELSSDPPLLDDELSDEPLEELDDWDPLREEELSSGCCCPPLLDGEP